MENKKREYGPHNAIRELLTIKLNSTDEFYGDFETPLDMLQEIADDIHQMNNPNARDTQNFMLSCVDLFSLFRIFKREIDRLILDCIALMQDMGEEDMIGDELDRFSECGKFEQRSKSPDWVKKTAREIVLEIEDKLP